MTMKPPPDAVWVVLFLGQCYSAVRHKNMAKECLLFCSMNPESTKEEDYEQEEGQLDQ